MTEEVGVITGEVTVRTVVVGELVTVRVQYLDADEWYEVEGSPWGGPPVLDRASTRRSSRPYGAACPTA
ncbi:hypothetical protein ACFQ0B_21120 [Nonomuraea thailandensis]